MPSYYYIVSNEVTRDIVERENFDAIDQYVANPKPFEGPLDGLGAPGFEPEQLAPDIAWVDGAYQIASRAVELGKESVLRHVGDKICFDCQRDGNSYDLFVLATEKHRFALIDVLWEIACENGYQRAVEGQLAYAARRLLGYANLDEEGIIKHLPHYVDKAPTLADVYHYSKRWEKPRIQAWLEEHCADKLADPSTNEAKCTHQIELTGFAKGPYQWSGWICDKCANEYPKGTERWFCRVCHSDVCVDCYSTSA